MSRRVDAFRFTSRVLTRAVLAAQALHQGLWLGLLDAEDLQGATGRYYGSSLRYADPAHNRAGFLGWEAALVDRHLAGCRTALIGAAGGGREVVALARRGIAVDAFECAPTLVAAAERLLQAEGLTARIRLAPPDELPDGLGTYDAVILGWGAYSHVLGRLARVRLLRELAGHLRPGGPLLFSFQTRSGDPAGPRTFRWIYGTAHAVRAIRRSRVPLELGDTLPSYFAHKFTRTEIEAEVAAAGLRAEHLRELEYGAVVARSADTTAAMP